MSTKGRPTVITTKTVSLLVTSFNNGLNVREAYLQSGISHETYYKRLREDSQFADTMTRAQLMPTLSAKLAIIKAIKDGNVRAAQWWLERKAKDEFSARIENEVTAVPSPVSSLNVNETLEELEQYKQRRERAKLAKYPKRPQEILALA